MFLFSYINQSIISIASDEYDLIIHNHINRLSSDLQKKLFSYGYIVEDHLEDFYKLKYFYNKSTYTNKAGALTLVTTMECNLSCYYCIQNPMKSRSRLDENKTKSVTLWLENWLKASAFDRIMVNIIGGEPFLNMDPVWEVSKVLSKSRIKNYGFKFITNGTLINETVLNDLKKLPVKGVQLTFDGCKENHNKVKQGSYDNLINVANLLVKNNIPLDIRINYPKGNLDFASKALDELGALIINKTGVCVYFAHLVEDTYLYNQCSVLNQEFDNQKSLFEKSLQLGFKIPNPVSSIICLGESDSSFVVGPDCKVYKCFNGVGVDDADFGYIKDGNLQIKSYKQLTRDIPSRCQGCKYLPLCHGGCHLQRNLSGDCGYNDCHIDAFNYIENDLLPLYIKQIVN